MRNLGDFIIRREGDNQPGWAALGELVDRLDAIQEDARVDQFATVLVMLTALAIDWMPKDRLPAVLGVLLATIKGRIDAGSVFREADQPPSEGVH